MRPKSTPDPSLYNSFSSNVFSYFWTSWNLLSDLVFHDENSIPTYSFDTIPIPSEPFGLFHQTGTTFNCHLLDI